MPAPEISAFGDGDHEYGETGLTIDGGGFGAFPGSAWIYENNDRSGALDQLTIGAWNDIQLSGIEIPGSPNNGAGTCYLFVQREDLAWSHAFSFTLSGGFVDLEIEDVEVATECPPVSLIGLTIEDVEVAIEGLSVSLRKLHIELVEVRFDDLSVNLSVNSYGEHLAADGMDRRAVA